MKDTQVRLTLGAALLLVGVGAAAWMMLAKPVRLHDASMGPSEADPAALPDMRLDINSATVAELTLLPGIGPGLAERIVRHRLEHGVFPSVDALLNVPGIGAGRLEAIAPHVVAEPPQ